MLHNARDVLILFQLGHDLLAPDDVLKELLEVRSRVVRTIEVGVEVNRLEDDVEPPHRLGKLALTRTVIVLRFAEHILDFTAVPKVGAGAGTA